MTVAGALLCMVAVAIPFYLWNGTRVLMSAKRVYGSDKFQARECTFTIRVYRFRPITEFEFSTDSYYRLTTDHYTFGAFTVDKINRIEWFPQRRAVLMNLEAELDSVNIAEPLPILYDFERACLLSPVHDKVAEGQLSEIAAGFRSRVEVQYSSILCRN